jgi:Protein of unknown function (DUF2934)
MAKRTTPKTDQETTVTPERRRASSVNQPDKPTAAKVTRRRKTDELAAESVSSVSAPVAEPEGLAVVASGAAEPAAGKSFVKVEDVVEIELSHDEIAERAYHIYLERGAQPGDPFADWLTAERQLRERLVGAR